MSGVDLSLDLPLSASPLSLSLSAIDQRQSLNAIDHSLDLPLSARLCMATHLIYLSVLDHSLLYHSVARPLTGNDTHSLAITPK